MLNHNFSLEICKNSQQWNKFVALSPQGTLYATANILESLGCEADYWFVMRNGYVAAAVPIVTSNIIGTGLPMHSYFIGIMYHPESWNCKLNRRTENILAISEVIMQELSLHYSKIELSLHPSLQDIRGIDWFNYHDPKKGRVNIYPRYTAQSMLQPRSLIRSEARGSRRREEKYAKSRENLSFSLDGTATELVNLLEQTFARQQTTMPEIEVKVTQNFAQCVLDNDLGIIAVTRNTEGIAQTAGLMLFDYHGLVHLPVVGIAETRYGGTLLYFSMMDYASDKGYQCMDFNGANSPSRGYFKHSIGAQSQLYFHMVWNKP